MLKQYWWTNNNGNLTLHDVMNNKKRCFYSFKSNRSDLTYYFCNRVASFEKRVGGNDILFKGSFISKTEKGNYKDFCSERAFSEAGVSEIKEITEEEFQELIDKLI